MPNLVDLRKPFIKLLLFSFKFLPSCRNDAHHLFKRDIWSLSHHLPLARLYELEVCMTPLLGLAVFWSPIFVVFFSLRIIVYLDDCCLLDWTFSLQLVGFVLKTPLLRELLSYKVFVCNWSGVFSKHFADSPHCKRTVILLLWGFLLNKILNLLRRFDSTGLGCWGVLFLWEFRNDFFLIADLHLLKTVLYFVCLKERFMRELCLREILS